MKLSVNSPCPCGSGEKYKKCCQIYHKGAIAKDALTLMKSRYSAFAVGDAKYIVKTSAFYEDLREIEAFCKGCSFEGLEIVEYVEGESESHVSFRVAITCGKEDASFREKSRFVKREGRWLYESGEIIG
jgi:SEC-C motif-containing protein